MGHGMWQSSNEHEYEASILNTQQSQSTNIQLVLHPRGSALWLTSGVTTQW